MMRPTDNSTEIVGADGMTFHQRYMRHQALAIVWVRYNSASGRWTERQMIKVMRQLSIDDLERMLAQRGYVIPKAGA